MAGFYMSLFFHMAVLFMVAYPILSQTTTSPNVTTDMTSTTTNGSMMANDTTTTSMTTTTVITTMSTTESTTMKPTVDVKHNTETAVLVLELTVGMDNHSEIHYSGNMTRMQLLEKLRSTLTVDNARLNLISRPESHGGDGTYTLVIEYFYGEISNSSIDSDKLVEALRTLANKTGFAVPANETFTKVMRFYMSSTDVCMARGACPTGFECNTEGCKLMCDDEMYCHGHGECVVSVMKNGTAAPICICDESYDTEYYGDHCEDDRIGKEQVIAIVAGVLGTACLILIIVVVYLIISKKRNEDNYSFPMSSTQPPAHSRNSEMYEKDETGGD